MYVCVYVCACVYACRYLSVYAYIHIISSPSLHAYAIVTFMLKMILTDVIMQYMQAFCNFFIAYPTSRLPGCHLLIPLHIFQFAVAHMCESQWSVAVNTHSR
jgi:hypothetical protein